MPRRNNKYKILILCDFDRNSANTIIDHALSFRRYSKYEIFYINPIRRNKPKWLNMNQFDVLIIHYSIYVLGEHYLNSTWREAISRSNAIKVQFIQDEYRTVYAIHDRMISLKINILYTCFPESEIEKVYPSVKFPGVKIINNFTGYVPEYFELSSPNFQRRRPLDVGYRGRGEGFWWLGSLYQEKSMIGREFLRYASQTGLKCDISSREEDRIYGRRWIQFLQNCRCTLGTESGASVVDFTGEIEQNVKGYCRSHPHTTFLEVQNLYFKNVEGKIIMNQISPRAFEAIGCGCCQILFEGWYSGILEPNKHYIPLKKDFTNIFEVLEKIKDETLVKNIAGFAYNDIISSGHYSYHNFINRFDRDLEDFMHSRTLKRHTKTSSVSASPVEIKKDAQVRIAASQIFHSHEKNSGFEGVQPFQNTLKEILSEKSVTTFLIRCYRWTKKIYSRHPFLLIERIKLLVWSLRKE